jgi:metal-responsive CopG/Arc/MetJ family transcriptional regulator
LNRLGRFFKKIPDGLFDELDHLAESKKASRAKFMKAMARFYIRNRMESKYQSCIKSYSAELAAIDLEFSEMCREIDNEQLNYYETQLGEKNGIDS